jgi:hypothetical protein
MTEPATEETDSDRPSAFLKAYLAWREARHGIEKAKLLDGKEHDEACGPLMEAEAKAEWEMVQAPLRDLYDLVDLAEAVCGVVADIDEFGVPEDGLHRAIAQKLLRETLKARSGDLNRS